MGTEDEYYTPLIRELTVGATRYLEFKWMNIPQSLNQLSNGTWVNDGGSTIVVTGESGLSSPLFLQQWFLEIFRLLHHYHIRNSECINYDGELCFDLGDMRTYLTPKVTIAPGGMIDSLAFRGSFEDLHMMHRLI